MSITPAIHPAYFRTCFREEAPISDWPSVFAIITAYATTGETWTAEENEMADRALEADTTIGSAAAAVSPIWRFSGWLCCAVSDSCDRKTGVTKWCR